ncbi:MULTISPECIES: excisionase family DNA-binding protein [Blautia]|uniref:excisionase family DNA-binding protein n=1 Tax=Blautia TaxID=572511 RepID=UPI001D00F126|nr:MULTISPECIES: excisionase family DNA-binding protein [Blautia]MCB5689209.1 helix-turn-helix domain-containing protein [Blautia wexlerae]
MYRQPDSLLNFRKKVKKFAFDHCKTCSEHYEELAQEQNIALANFRRKKLSQTGIRGSNGNIKYLIFDEASYLAKVSRSMINKWADKGKFTVIKVGSRVRIRRDKFEDWMEQRDLERSMQ